MIADLTRERRVRSTMRAITEEGRAARGLEVLPAGTLLYSMYASLGAVSILEIDAAVNQAIIGIQPRASILDAEFALFYLESLRPSVVRLASASTQANLNADKVRSLPVLVPSIPEQAAISSYLDYTDRRIRRYIHAKRRLITLLEEQKQVIFHHAVTRGLDPSVRLKPSGVEWMGHVPEHWDVVRLGALLRERGETNSDGVVTEVLSLLRHRGVIPYDEKGNIGNKKSEDTTRYKIVRPNDIVMNCMNVIIGSVGLSTYTGCLSPVYYVLTCRSDHVSPHYMNAVFQCRPFHRSLVRIGNGILAHRMRIPMELLKCELVPRPPIEEQHSIVRYLDEQKRNCDQAIEHAEREISLLQEYRARLISDVVTGKLDVREAAAQLPDEVEREEMLDDADVLVEGDEADDEGDFDAVLEEAEA